MKSHTVCMQEGKKLPKLTDIMESDDEPEPDVVLEVPLKKVKLVVGPGGERIKVIERKSKARLQVCAARCLFSGQRLELGADISCLHANSPFMAT